MRRISFFGISVPLFLYTNPSRRAFFAISSRVNVPVAHNSKSLRTIGARSSSTIIRSGALLLGMLLMDAIENADKEAVESARKALEGRITDEAKRISAKYIQPPKTTDFAILFLPTEGLYAELSQCRQ